MCTSYRAIKLPGQLMKVLEKVLKKTVWCQCITCSWASCLAREPLMPVSSEKHQAKKKRLYYAFVDLEKAFDRVPMEVVKCDLRKL